MKPCRRIPAFSVKSSFSTRSICLLLIFVSAVSMALADEMMARLDRQLEEFPQEKVHVMTDRDVYCGGDTVWFRIFIVDAATHQPLSISKYAYAEIRDPFGGVLNRVKIKEEDGVYAGYIPIREDIAEGDYMLTAYTAFMENAGEEYFFKKRLPLLTPYSAAYAIDADFESNGEGRVQGHFRLRSLKDRKMNYNIMSWEMPDGKTLEMPDAKNGFKKTFDRRKGEDRVLVKFGDYTKYFHVPFPSEKTSLRFFPEGGYLVPGEMCRVAFKATDEDGHGVHASGYITDSDGEKVCEFATSHRGMGSVFFMPEQGKTYTAVYVNPDTTEERAEVGTTDSDAAVLRVVYSSSRTTFSVAGAGTDNSERPLELLVALRGKGMIHAPISKSAPLSVPKKDLPTGLYQAFLVSPRDSAVLSERLFFIGADRPQEKMATLSPDSTAIIFNLPEGTEADCAIRITNSRLAPSDKSTDIRTQLLLQSELRGRIEDPAYYFAENDREAAQNLDLVMMTNGWSRYDIPEAIRGRYAEPSIPLEIGQEISGQVLSRWRNKPLKDVMVCAIAPKVGFATFVDTDENGEFRLNGFDFPEDTPFILQAMNEKGGLEGNFDAYPEKYPKISEPPVDHSSLSPSDISAFFSGSYWTMLPEIKVQAFKKDGGSIVDVLSSYTKTSDDFDKRGITSLEQAIRGIAGLTYQGSIVYWRGAEVAYYIDGTIYDPYGAGDFAKLGHSAPIKSPKIYDYSKNMTRGIVYTPQPAQTSKFPTLSDVEGIVPFHAVDRIDFLRPEACLVIGPNWGGGIIMITTKDGSDSSWSRQYELKDHLPLGYQEHKEYSSPLLSESFSEYELQNSNTLLWIPSVKKAYADRQPKLSLTNSNAMDIKIEGISNSGIFNQNL